MHLTHASDMFISLMHPTHLNHTFLAYPSHTSISSPFHTSVLNTFHLTIPSHTAAISHTLIGAWMDAGPMVVGRFS